MFGSRKQDAAFFDAFTEHAGKSIEAAKLLVAMLKRLQPEDTSVPVYRPAERPTSPESAQELDEELKRMAAQIKEVESAGDTITHQTVKSLRENWITPLDRNDIHALISRMDDVLDLIEAAAERITLFRVDAAVPEAHALAELIVSCCELLAKALGLLRTLSKASEILDLCVEVNRLENEADKLYRKALADLFTAGNDPLTVMKWRDIFDSLESAVDRCEDVANIVEGVVLEYA